MENRLFVLSKHLIVRTQTQDFSLLAASNSDISDKEFHVDKLSPDEIRQKFDMLAPNWNHYVQNSRYMLFEWLKEETKMLKNHFSRTSLILDLGCGPGLIGKSLRENGILGTLVGVDISTEMLSRAIATQVYKSVIQCDLNSDFHVDINSQFDLICCFGTLEMIKDLSRFLQNLRQLLKDEGGQAWISVQWNKDGTNPLGFQSMRHFTVSEIRKITCSLNFSLTSIKTVDAAYFKTTQDGTFTPIPYIFFKLTKNQK